MVASTAGIQCSAVHRIDHPTLQPLWVIEMNTKEKIAVMQAWLDGEKIEVASCRDGIWRELEGLPDWNWRSNVYRIKPEEIIKPSIEWDHVAEYFNFLATDHAEIPFLYEYKPVWSPTLKCWTVSRGEYIPARYFQSFKQGVNCPPKNSLVERPREKL